MDKKDNFKRNIFLMTSFSILDLAISKFGSLKDFNGSIQQNSRTQFHNRQAKVSYIPLSFWFPAQRKGTTHHSEIN